MHVDTCWQKQYKKHYGLMAHLTSFAGIMLEQRVNQSLYL